MLFTFVSQVHLLSRSLGSRTVANYPTMIIIDTLYMETAELLLDYPRFARKMPVNTHALCETISVLRPVVVFLPFKVCFIFTFKYFLLLDPLVKALSMF